jgi:hypothetical protein
MYLVFASSSFVLLAVPADEFVWFHSCAFQTLFFSGEKDLVKVLKT